MTQSRMPDPRTSVVSNPSSASKRQGPRTEKPSEPWKQANLLETPAEARAMWPDNGFRWVRMSGKNGNDRIEEKLGEGYHICRRNGKPKAAGGDTNVDGADITGAWTRRGCILMRLPPDRGQARKYEMEQAVIDQNDSIQRKHEDRLAAEGGIGYGSTGLTTPR